MFTFLWKKNGFVVLFYLLMIQSAPQVNALVQPPDPFDSTEHHALLIPAKDGTITSVHAKVKPPADSLSGTGELRAIMGYRVPQAAGRYKVRSSVSEPVAMRTLDPTRIQNLNFQFTTEPVPADAYHRTLRAAAGPDLDGH